MASSNLTTNPISTLAAKNLTDGYLLDYEEDVATGLRLVASPTGTKSWIYRYRSPTDGKMRQMKLGTYPAMPMKEARKKRDEQKELRDQGNDPRLLKKQHKAERIAQAAEQEKTAFTVAVMVDLYLTGHVSEMRKPKGQRDVARLFKANVIPAMGDLLATDVTRPMVRDLKDTIVARGAPVLAGIVVRELRAAFEHAINEEVLPDTFINPCFRVKTPKTKSRSRALNDGEIAHLLRWLPESPFSQSTRDALLLVLFTACRSGEVIAAQWKDIDLDTGTWFLSADSTKTEVERTVQLSRQAVALLRSRPSDSVYVFPSPTYPKTHILQTSLSFAVTTKRESSNLEEWTPHDLRRTARTGMASMGCPYEVGEAALGHTKQGIEGTYNRYKYEAECKVWLQKWCDHIDNLRAAENLVAIGGARA